MKKPSPTKKLPATTGRGETASGSSTRTSSPDTSALPLDPSAPPSTQPPTQPPTQQPTGKRRKKKEPGTSAAAESKKGRVRAPQDATSGAAVTTLTEQPASADSERKGEDAAGEEPPLGAMDDEDVDAMLEKGPPSTTDRKGTSKDPILDKQQAPADGDEEEEEDAGPPLMTDPDYEEYMRGKTAEATAQMKLLLDAMSPEQQQRFETYRSAAFSRTQIKKLVSQTLGQAVPDKLAAMVGGVAKTFVGELMEAARDVMEERGVPADAAIAPEHLREANRRLRAKGAIPSARYQPRMFL